MVEMGLDFDDLGGEQVHKLGSLHKARLKIDTPKRPVIAALQTYRNCSGCHFHVEKHELLSI